MSSISHQTAATKRGASPYHGASQQQYYQYQYGAAPMSPYAYHHHPSPMMAVQGGYGGYGSSYARAVALNHPGNYSPLVERHDYYPMDKTSSRSGGGGGGGGAGVTTYRSVPRRGSDSGSGGCCIQ